ncbi:hypothetical protein GRF29_161g1120846 [Pseudopithomyces chartarum]|uniref:Uncharacterized protein n=1 Tax=Pseudopithomyces chartarum TaxID=1892770 RepID=A0AAN6LQH9_9PLEO|nr:hypothetical protein GRF29_161g1120846 [Pseudopithomyces chartarum]
MQPRTRREPAPICTCAQASQPASHGDASVAASASPRTHVDTLDRCKGYVHSLPISLLRLYVLSFAPARLSSADTLGRSFLRAGATEGTWTSWALALALAFTASSRFVPSSLHRRTAAPLTPQSIMANTGTILSTLLFCLWWPTSKLLSVFALVLSPFWAVLQFVLLPVIYLAHAVYAVLSLPFKLNILERIETIYVWVGIAALIGCIAGGVLFVIFSFITSAFRIDRAADPQRKSQGRTVRDFRAARRGKKETLSESPSRPRVDKVAVLRRRGPTVQSILEDESEF